MAAGFTSGTRSLAAGLGLFRVGGVACADDRRVKVELGSSDATRTGGPRPPSRHGRRRARPQRGDEPAPKRAKSGGSRDALLAIAAAAAAAPTAAPDVVKWEPRRGPVLVGGLLALCAASSSSSSSSSSSENRPAPPAPRPDNTYDAADAVRVRALMGRLGVTQAEVRRACGAGSGGLWAWLNGRDTQRPGVLKAGAAAMRWHEETPKLGA